MSRLAAAPVSCVLAPRELSRFTALLQRGVAVRARGGATLERFLRDDLGLAPGYVAERISTVFLDGQVVDRLEDAVVRDGSRVALSAAMPGLVGATLRRSGFYAPMRGAITHRAPASRRSAAEDAVVEVKLFNLLIAELGPVLLARGAVIARREAEQLLAGVRTALPDGDLVELRVRLEPEAA